MSDLHYPNLAPCRVVVNGSSGSTHPPVRLPAACVAAAKEPEISSPYDFALGTTQPKAVVVAQPNNPLVAQSLTKTCANSFHDTEKTVMDSRDERLRIIASASSEEEIKQTVLAKMQSLTNASEHICVELLESNKYDLNTSVEAYFAK